MFLERRQNPRKIPVKNIISLIKFQACNSTKHELIHRYLSRVFLKFKVISFYIFNLGIATLNELLPAIPSVLHTSFSWAAIAASLINGQNHWKIYVKETKINRIKRNRNVKNSVDTVKVSDTILIYCIVLYRIQSDCLLL